MRKRSILAGLVAISAVLAFASLPARAAAPASLGDGGMTFSSGIATDPQRDVGEPEIHIDRLGRIWTCGPSGFSNVADYAQVSTDGGDQFHLLGQAPRGQISGGEGGGDCGLSTSPTPVTPGGSDYTFAYTGLGPLANFGTGTSTDGGRTFIAGPVSESPPGVDRQWLVFTDAKTVFMNFNHLSEGYTVQKSTDGGLTYGEPLFVGGGEGRIGPLRAILSPDLDPAKAVVYFPSNNGNTITLFLSRDGGANWSHCTVLNAGFNPLAGFVIADHDAAGNIYLAYSGKGANVGGRDTWMASVPAAKIPTCTGGYNTSLGAKQVRVNRDAVETTVMPWLVAGDTGRVAISYFGTDSDGNPDSGAFVASWYPYISMTLDALNANPSWYQAKATAHPFHYGSICLGGLGCDIPLPDENNPTQPPKKGDRSLADYFAMDLDPTTGRLHIVYGTSAKKPSDEIGHVSTATVVSQETGPSLLASKTLVSRRPALRQASDDPAGDALAPYSQLYITPSSVNQSAMDIRRVEAGPEIDLTTSSPVPDGGVTVTIKLADLSDAALQSAASSTNAQSLVYLFRFLNGFQPAGASAAWSPAFGWSFGFDDFTTKSTESGQADPTAEKIIVWNQRTPIQGKVSGNEIKLSIPRALLAAQVGPTGANQVPHLQPVTNGSRLFDGMAYSLVNAFSPTQAVQSYLYPVDATPAMDFLVGVAPATQTGTQSSKGPQVLGARRHLPATGVSDDASVAALALSLALAAAVTVRRLRTR